MGGTEHSLVFLTIVIQSQLMYLSKICTSANYFFEIILILKLFCEPLVSYGWGPHNPRTDSSYYDIKVSSYDKGQNNSAVDPSNYESR